jgi:flagellar hook-associated protein 3 FlgL
MRVTQLMMSKQFIGGLQKNNSAMSTTQAQISSGRKFEKVSDNPTAALQGISLRSSMVQIEQYQKNAQDGTDWLDAVDDTLGKVTDVLQRVRELSVEASNDTNDGSTRKTIAVEMRSLQQQISDFANTPFGDDYLFSGKSSDIPPYQNGILQNTDQDPKQWNIGKGQNINVNVHAGSVFGFSVDGKNLFDTIGSIAQVLENGENPGSQLAAIDKQMNNVLNQTAIVGSNSNLLELALNKLDQASFLHEKMLSDAEDTDIAQAFTELSLQETALKASMEAGSRITQLSLVDYLR